MACDKLHYDRCFRNATLSQPCIILMSSVKTHSWSGSLPEATKPTHTGLRACAQMCVFEFSVVPLASSLGIPGKCVVRVCIDMSPILYFKTKLS